MKFWNAIAYFWKTGIRFMWNLLQNSNNNGVITAFPITHCRTGWESGVRAGKRIQHAEGGVSIDRNCICSCHREFSDYYVSDVSRKSDLKKKKKVICSPAKESDLTDIRWGAGICIFNKPSRLFKCRLSEDFTLKNTAHSEQLMLQIFYTEVKCGKLSSLRGC